MLKFEKIGLVNQVEILKKMRKLGKLKIIFEI